MMTSIADLIILSLVADWILTRLRLPGLLGMLLIGVLFGPHVLDWLEPGLLAIGADLRVIALIVILLRAGFQLNLQSLNRVGGRVVLLSVVPAFAEGVAITLAGPRLLGLTWLESAMLGSVLAAVSPAVVVPSMIRFIHGRRGEEHGAPTMVLASASLEDVCVIVVHGVLVGLYAGRHVNLAWNLVGIPLSVVSGVLVGIATGVVLYRLFDRFNPRATKRMLTLIAVSILLLRLEDAIKPWAPFAALVASMAIGFIILEKREHMAHEISAKLAKLWVFAEIVLFAMVGAQVDLSVAWSAGLAGAAVIGCGLCGRAVGVALCLARSRLTRKERAFVMVSFMPKATVQAAIGAVPLMAMQGAGLDTGPGQIILAVAVLSIVLTAPAGAWAIAILGGRLLPPAPAGHGNG